MTQVKEDGEVNFRRVSVFTLIGLCVAGAGYWRSMHAVEDLGGTLLFHNYTSYEAWDGHLFTLDLESRRLTDLTDSWQNVKHTINGSFSFDGKYITFMGSNSDRQDWDVYISHWNGQKWDEPINITGPNGKRDEDPKFSPRGNTIIYKEDGILTLRQIQNNKPSLPSYVVSDKAESSMPFFLPNGRDYLYESSGEIYLSVNGKSIAMYSGNGLKSYYPIALSDKAFIFTRVQNSRHDAIMKGFYNGSKSESYFFNSDQWDSSDPYPYKDGSEFIFFVSTNYIVPKGGYNLEIADLKHKKTINIDDIYGSVNTDKEELGPAWTRFAY